MKNNALLSLFLMSLLVCASCTDSKQYEAAICTLVDISGTYASEKATVTKYIKAGVLNSIEPGDSLFFITIDSNSFQEENLKAKLTLDYKPSQANKQKLAFANKLDEFAKSDEWSKLTDISGAMMICGDYLRDTGSGIQAMLIFSDMKEELKKGVKRNFREKEFDGIDIAAMNVIKLNKDTEDPEKFRTRIDTWQSRIEKAGAKSWNVVVDATKVPEFITNLRD